MLLLRLLYFGCKIHLLIVFIINSINIKKVHNILYLINNNLIKRLTEIPPTTEVVGFLSENFMKDLKKLLTTGVIVEFNDKTYGLVLDNMIISYDNDCMINELDDELYLTRSTYIKKIWQRRDGDVDSDSDVRLVIHSVLFDNCTIDDDIFRIIYDSDSDSDSDYIYENNDAIFEEEINTEKLVPLKKIGIYSGKRYIQKHRK